MGSAVLTQMGSTAVEKTEEITERLRDPRGLRRGALADLFFELMVVSAKRENAEVVRRGTVSSFLLHDDDIL
ncbi:hypothetical protein VIGAN_05151300 [Vigna angularis var. angularis]|uniref:Uncharacterized protein n=1 Tax=Vigna angularis var. angularis TaxID=157739 RepID=A0A0S3S5H8_PHAAN|nr:hypothetical protein VIGAN_05151300 [Vigna angularis var. angularis]